MKSFFGNLTDREFSRRKCHGYKKLVFDEGVVTGSVLDMVSGDDGESLVVKATGETPVEGTGYTFLCKEFGLYDDSVSAKVSVIFCDNGWMLVTLLEGSFLIKHEDEILQPTVGSGSYPAVYKDEILWVDADKLLSGKKYFGSEFQQINWQDFEYIFTVSGCIKNKLLSFRCKHHYDEYIDLSLGYIAKLEEKLLRKKQEEASRSILSMFETDDEQGGITFDSFGDEDEDYDDDEYDDEEADFSL